MSRRKSSPLGCIGVACVCLWLSSQCAKSNAPQPTPIPYRQPTAAEIANEERLRKEAEAEAIKAQRAIAQKDRDYQAHLKRQEANETRQRVKEETENRIADAKEDAERAQEHNEPPETTTSRTFQQRPMVLQQDQGSVAEGYRNVPSGRTHVGPRGGVFHYSASGKKVYEKH